MDLTIPQPHPLFDSLESIHKPTNAYTIQYLRSLTNQEIETEYELSKQFLAHYVSSRDSYSAYRREIERLLNWSWLYANKPVKQLNVQHLRHYLAFVHSPPNTWISAKTVNRFKTVSRKRRPNPDWRPFVKRGSDKYQLHSSSVHSLLAILSVYFGFLVNNGYLKSNPVYYLKLQLPKVAKSKTKPRRLSQMQWQSIITAAVELTHEKQTYECLLFMLSAFYLLNLRVSSLAETTSHHPKMRDFHQLDDGQWYYKTIDTHGQPQQLVVPDAMLAALKRYRQSLGLPALPTAQEQTPLLPKQRGTGGLGARQIRHLVQICFDKAIIKLKDSGLNAEAQELANATVQWLRQTRQQTDLRVS